MSDTAAEAERAILRQAMAIYKTPDARKAVRGGMSDAAHLLDAIARDIADAHRVRGRVTKQGEALALAVARAADAVWAMREKITVGMVNLPSAPA